MPLRLSRRRQSEKWNTGSDHGVSNVPGVTFSCRGTTVYLPTMGSLISSISSLTRPVVVTITNVTSLMTRSQKTCQHQNEVYWVICHLYSLPFCPMQVRDDELAASSCADVPITDVAGVLRAFCSSGFV